MKLLFALTISALIAATIAQNAGGKSIDDLITDVFGKNPNTGGDNTGGTVDNKGSTSSTGSGGGGGNGQCECVPYYLCNNNTIITDGVGLIDIRINDGPCESYLDFCCNPPNVQPDPITPKPVVTTGCGVHNPNGVGFRITGDKDNEAQFGEFPWMVAVLREEAIEGNAEPLNVYQCGGALIHPKAVITAAHCVTQHKEKKFKIRAGEWDTQTKKELYPEQDRDVESIVIHPQYYAGGLFNDIAFLLLKEPFELAENVGVVCLPPQNTNFDKSRCYATGWGKDVFGKEGKYQAILKKIDLPVVNRDTCQNQLRTTRLGKFFELHRSFMCAGGEPGKDTCKGDGGSPLVCPIPGNPDRYYHAGIVAWGIGCGENGIPGVYADVSTFRNWIDEQMTYNNLDQAVYKF